MNFFFCFSVWSKNYFIVTGIADNQAPRFAIFDTKTYVPVVTLSAQDNANQLQQLKTGFKRTVNWNKYQLEPTIPTQKPILKLLN